MKIDKNRTFAALRGASSPARAGSGAVIEWRTPGTAIGERVRAGGLRISAPGPLEGLRPYRTLN